MLRESLYWVSQGQPRTNTDLATLLIAKGRFQEAIPVARGAMRAPFNARSAVTNYTAARELLARAYEGAGNKDSARVHREWVARARQ